jgi:3-oxoacyl-[acyl-carrier protein] reductase
VDLGLAGRTAAVAAASTGLGLATARALAAEGVRVAICGREQDRLDHAAGTFPDGTPVVTVVADVSEPGKARGFVGAAQERLGSVDILVANAGGPPGGTFKSTELEGYEDALRLNLLSTVEMCQAAVPAMQEQRWGRVVAITSVGARMPLGHLIASSTARAGVTAFLKVLAQEVAGDGITVNSIQPGMHKTDRLAHLGADLDDLAKTVPVGFLGDPDDFGAVVTFLCSEQAKFITGIALPIEGGTYPGLQ